MQLSLGFCIYIYFEILDTDKKTFVFLSYIQYVSYSLISYSGKTQKEIHLRMINFAYLKGICKCLSKWKFKIKSLVLFYRKLKKYQFNPTIIF